MRNRFATKGLGHAIDPATVRRSDAEPHLFLGVITLEPEFMRDLASFPDPTRADR
jgi:hypothetical protein